MSTELTTASDNVFASYGAKVATQGTFLSFKNGEYLAGQDGTEIPLNTRMVANMGGLRIGWRRWSGDRLTDDLTELLTEQRPIAQRNTLGDDDQANWETDNAGKPRDPWQLTNVIEFVDSEGEAYIYSTGSKGGIGAIGRLCKEYGKLYRQKPGMAPIVTLGRDFYMHKEYGKTYFPVFEIVGWADEDTLEPEETADALPFDPEPTKEPEPAVPAKVAAPTNGARKARF